MTSEFRDDMEIARCRVLLHLNWHAWALQETRDWLLWEDGFISQNNYPRAYLAKHDAEWLKQHDTKQEATDDK